MKKGDKAELPPHTIKGVIMRKRYNEGADKFEYLLAYEENGEKHERWFLEGQLIASPEEAE